MSNLSENRYRLSAIGERVSNDMRRQHYCTVLYQYIFKFFVEQGSDDMRMQQHRICLLKHLWRLNDDKIEGFITNKYI